MLFIDGLAAGDKVGEDVGEEVRVAGPEFEERTCTDTLPGRIDLLVAIVLKTKDSAGY